MRQLARLHTAYIIKWGIVVTDKMQKCLNNAIASVRMEGFEFAPEQLDFLTDLVERVDCGEITWDEAIGTILKKYK